MDTKMALVVDLLILNRNNLDQILALLGDRHLKEDAIGGIQYENHRS